MTLSPILMSIQNFPSKRETYSNYDIFEEKHLINFRKVKKRTLKLPWGQRTVEHYLYILEILLHLWLKSVIAFLRAEFVIYPLAKSDLWSKSSSLDLQTFADHQRVQIIAYLLGDCTSNKCLAVLTKLVFAKSAEYNMFTKDINHKFNALNQIAT